MIRISITTETIRLSQFLKLAAAVEDGVEAKWCIRDGEVTVNNEPERRRGRKLRPGDRVELGGVVYEVAVEKNAA